MNKLFHYKDEKSRSIFHSLKRLANYFVKWFPWGSPKQLGQFYIETMHRRYKGTGVF